MSLNIKQLFEDKQKSIPVYPNTKVEAITNDSGTPLVNLLGKTYTNIVVGPITPSQLDVYEAWDSDQEFGYYVDVVITGISTADVLINFVCSTSILNNVAPFVETFENKIRLFTDSQTSLSGVIYSITTRRED